MLTNPEMQGLLARWKEEARTLRNRYGLDALADLSETHAAELLDVLHAGEEKTVNLTEASRLCGYKPDSLGKMIRQGRLPSVGRRHAPRLRVGDLPCRPGFPSPLHHAPAPLHLEERSVDRARAVVADS